METILLTGGTAGLGLAAARDIAAKYPEAQLVLASRSGQEQAELLRKSSGSSNIHFLRLDLSSQKQIREFAAQFKSTYAPISHFIMNAGTQILELQHSPDGVESTFAINHLGHFLLFQLLRDHMTLSARITVVSSGTHDPAQKSGMPDPIYASAEALAHPDPTDLNWNGRRRYSTSKLCNVLFTYELNRRLRAKGSQVTVNAFDPGLMPGTELARDASATLRFLWHYVLPYSIPLLRLTISHNVHTPAESARNLVHLAMNEDGRSATGEYYEGPITIKSSEASYEQAKQTDLWDTSVTLLKATDAEATSFNNI